MYAIRSYYDQPVDAGLGGPDLARPAQDLAHVRVRFVAREGLECLGRGIEADDRVGGPFAHPDDVLRIDIDGVGMRRFARQLV